MNVKPRVQQNTGRFNRRPFTFEVKFYKIMITMATLLKNRSAHVRFEDLCEKCVKRVLQNSLLEFCVKNRKSKYCDFDVDPNWVRICDGLHTKEMQVALLDYVRQRGLLRIVRIWRNNQWLYFKIYDKWTREMCIPANPSTSKTSNKSL